MNECQVFFYFAVTWDPSPERWSRRRPASLHSLLLEYFWAPHDMLLDARRAWLLLRGLASSIFQKQSLVLGHIQNGKG